MQDVSAIVSVVFGATATYNIVSIDGEFSNTGESIISLLNNHKIDFIADIVASQSYGAIAFIDDDGIYFGDDDCDDINTCTYNEIYQMMKSESAIADNFYVYDVLQDVLLIKTPELPNPIALDYTNKSDIEHFRHLIS